MELNNQTKYIIIKAYVLMFYLVASYKILTSFFLFQLSPTFFSNKLDVTTWIVMLTNLQHSVIINNTYPYLLDAVFYSQPLIYFIVVKVNINYAYLIGILMFITNIVYSTIYCTFPSQSIESFIAFILFPFLFITKRLKSFWFVLHGIRYYFIYFFFSAGVWKFIQGGIFLKDQMSNTLISQHQDLFIVNEPSVLLDFYRWLIINPSISYFLYFSATIIEIFFFIGFITRRFDKLLICLFILFLISNYLIMQINYIAVTPFLITLYFSTYMLPGKEINSRHFNAISYN